MLRFNSRKRLKQFDFVWETLYGLRTEAEKVERTEKLYTYSIIEYITQSLFCSGNPTYRSARRQINHQKFSSVQFSKITAIFVSKFLKSSGNFFIVLFKVWLEIIKKDEI